MQLLPVRGGRLLYRLLTSCIFLSLFCYTGQAQATNRQEDKKITLFANEIAMRDVFKVIRKQTGLTVTFSNTEVKINLNEKINAYFSDTPLEEVMRYLLKNKQNLTFSISTKNEAVYILKEDNPEKNPIPSKNESDTSSTVFSLTGKVTDETGSPLVGATVLVKGSQQGATTDEQGNFTLPSVSNGVQLLVSNVGYETRALLVKGKSIWVKLPLVIQGLDETVVIAYGTSTKRMLTGTVSRVTGEVISKQPVADPIVALEGRVPGLFIAQSSGVPGSNVTVRLRGQNSIANGNDPLYIVDGVPFNSTSLTNTTIGGGVTFLSPFSSINPSDIESIEVLKDADATAIYGSRGANGVVLITTKKGKAGKTQFDINVYSGFGKVTRLMDLLDSKQYLEMRREAYANYGTPISGSLARDLLLWDTTRYTDWQKVFIGGTSHITNAQATILGGNANTQFVVGGDYRRESTVFPGSYLNQKASLHISLTNVSNNQRFQTTFSGFFLNDNSLLPTADFTNYITLAPVAPALYDAHGNLNWENSTWENPFALLYQKSKAVTKNINANLQLNYKILPSLSVKSNFGYTNRQMDQSMIFPMSSYDPVVSSITSLRVNNFATNHIETWIIEPQIDYKKKVGEHSLEGLIGITFQDNTQNTIAQTASDFANDELIENVASAATVRVLSNSYTKYRYDAIFGRVSYRFRERYLINLTARRDGSSRFGVRKRFGNFGAIGAGWIFSEEPLVQNALSFLSFGKIRLSYGSTGNDQLSDYQYLSTYSSYSDPYLGVTGLYPTRVVNPYYSWESVKKLEVGLELGFIKDKILFNLNYYRNRTNNQLVGYSLPLMTGFASVQANLPAVIQNTGLELELNTININCRNFGWKSSVNISFPRNKLVSYPNLEGSTYANRYVIGQSLFVQKLYHYTGVDPETGIYTFEDTNKDGSITFPEDIKPTKKIAQDYFGGIQNGISYKGFQLDFFVQFVKQTGRNYLSYFGRPGQFNSNQPPIVQRRWQNLGDKTDIQKFSRSAGNPAGLAYSDAVNFSDIIIGDASFVRLKNLSLSYQLPAKWKGKLNLESSRIYLQCQNLFTITNYIGLDPENQSLSLPPLRVITAGIQLTF